MKLMANLANSQLKTNRSRSVWTMLGIVLATAMITAVFGFAASGAVMFNEMVGDNEYYTNMYNATLYGVGMVFVSIIVVAAVVVMSNAFRVSAGERTMQFGILKSVGATSKQISSSILYEGMILCLIGIPFGIALGLFVQFVGTEIVNYFLVGLNRLNEDNPMILRFIFAWQAVIMAAAVSFLTVLLSAWLPAKKASKVSAIDSIRGAGEISVKKTKKLRANPLVRLLFGFEGTLASKSLKRSRRAFRATVLSLTVSVILFIVVGYFGIMLGVTTDLFYADTDANVAVIFHNSENTVYDDEYNLVERIYSPISSSLNNEISQTLREYPDSKVFGVGSDSRPYSVTVPGTMMTPKMLEVYVNAGYEDLSEIDVSASFISVDKFNYERLCQIAGVPVGSNILLNTYTYYFEGGRSIFAPYEFSEQTLTIRDWDMDTEAETELTLHGVLALEDMPEELGLAASGSFSVLVPEAEMTHCMWFVNTGDATGFTAFAEETFNRMLPVDGEYSSWAVSNLEEIADAQTDFGTMIMVFVYGFVGMLTLIGLTNVISTISTNVRSRTKEFAVLRSVGMTPGGLGRMLNLESILCSMRALIIGVPLGILGSYLQFNSMEMPVEIAFNIPWAPIIQCVLGVFVITWVTMRYAASRLRRNSISEAITGIA